MSRIKPIPNRAVCFAALALGLLAANPLTMAGPVKVGDSFPDLASFTLEGSIPPSLRGKIVVVDFWASWCGPCKASFPVMEQLHRQYAKDGLVIVAVNLDDKRAEMDAFLKKNPVTFTVVRDAAKQLVAVANIATMPTSFVIDSEGKVRAVHNGFHGDASRKKYVEEIEELLRTQSPRVTQ